jgi:phosphoribosylformylglycinamidine synthase subunit PurQ / glutaminase
MKPKALILMANGTNRDLDVCQAFELAGALPEIVPLNSLRDGKRHLVDYQLLILPGGFSYADALGAGKLLALDLQIFFADAVGAFIQQGKPVIGICNGFQALVKSGLLPAISPTSATPEATLTFNARGHFECRWVTLKPFSRSCVWTRDLAEDIYCPVAHGEGNFLPANNEILGRMQGNGQIALVYSMPDGSPAGGQYPYNPNGSVFDVAGICNPQGNVLGLMPHPENHIFSYQHPRRTRGEQDGLGLPLFVNGVRFAAAI